MSHPYPSVLAGETPKPKCKQLCENIFDVPRSSLLDVLQDLQNAFWSDQPSEISTSAPLTNDTTAIVSLENQARTRQQEPLQGSGQSHKRLRLTAEPTHLQQQISTPGADYNQQQPTSPSPPSSPGRHIISEPVYAKDVSKLLPTIHNNVSVREDDETPPMNFGQSSGRYSTNSNPSITITRKNRS
ncbi:unnamed protein product [Absidia cylindrospora]